MKHNSAFLKTYIKILRYVNSLYKALNIIDVFGSLDSCIDDFHTNETKDL